MADLAKSAHPQNDPTASVPHSLRVAGTAVRSIFLLAVMIVTWSITMPQTMTALTHFSLGDFIRVGIGVSVCAGVIWQLIHLPRDGEAYKTWVYIGAAMAFVGLVFLTLRFGLAI
jgi:hypothetical protein